MFTKELLKELKIYINSYTKVTELYSAFDSTKSYDDELERFIDKNRSTSFNELLFSLIDKFSLKDSEVYKKALIDRRLFSKIRSNANYHPSKRTVIALALALNLDKSNFDRLLNSAGYSLSDNDTFDLVIQFCLQKNIYNLHDVNLALNHLGIKPLI